MTVSSSAHTGCRVVVLLLVALSFCHAFAAEKLLAFIRTHAPVLERFTRAMAEAMKIMFKDKNLTYKVLGKHLRIDDRKILDAAYDEEIKVMESRLKFKMDSIQAIVDEAAKTDSRAKKIKPQDLVDRSLLDRLQNDGSFDWAGK